MRIIGNLKACAAVSALISSAGLAIADPVPTANVFCFRVMDFERFGAGDINFALSFEVLNWTDAPAWGLSIATTIGSTSTAGAIPSFAGAGIDRDGRGGPLGGDDIDAKGPGLTVGSGTFDTPAVHSGRGRGDVAGLLNDWEADFATSVSAQWSGDVGTDTAIPNIDLFNSTNPASLVPMGPGGLDSTGDADVDGGPGVTLPYADGAGNVLDGITLSVEDWNVDEILSFNWFLLDDAGQPIGSAGVIPSNPYGFGVVNMVRVAPGSTALPNAVFQGNTGFGLGGTTPPLFYDGVFDVPNPARFAMELGAGITAPFLDPATNIFDVQVNSSIIPLPGSLLFVFSGLAVFAGMRRRQLIG